MDNLSAYLLSGEVIVAIEDYPQSMLSQNNGLTIFWAYLLLSSPFLFFIGFVLVCTPGNSIQGYMTNLMPPIIGMALVAVMFYRFRDYWTQVLMETRYVITNYRLFSAPSDSTISEGKWQGPEGSGDVLFADVLLVRKGKIRGNEYVDLVQVDESYDGHENFGVTKKKRIFVKSANMVMEQLPPFLKSSTFTVIAKEPVDRAFERASAHIRLQREMVGQEYPSISNRMTKRV